MDVISKKEAREQGLPFYFTGKPCSKGHISERHTLGGNCRVCQKARKSTEEYKSYQKKHRAENKEYYLERTRLYRAAGKGKYKKTSKEWKKNNRSSVNASNAKRKASKLKATPPWLSKEDKKTIAAIYKMSTRLSSCLGIEHHVDHIVPLKGDSVCGLHVPWNLQAIPATINIRKNNKLPEDLP